jgi:integrase
MLPAGVHKVRRKLAGGRLAEHWYAWRGGPSILRATGSSLADLERSISSLAPAAIKAHAEAVKPPAAPDILDTLITRFLEPVEGKPPPHLSHLSPRSMSDLRRELDRVRLDLGEMETKALAATGARKALLAWHEGYAATPCTADANMAALDRVLKWAAGREEIAENPIKDWPRLYRPQNHAEALWTKPDLIKLLKGAPAPFRQAVLFSIFTGLRGSDIVRVTWSHVGKKAITFATGKSRGRRVITVPITPPLRALLAQIGRKDVGVVLTSSFGEAWSFSGLQTAMQRRKAEVGIKDLRWHDLRGTAATRLIRAGLSVDDVAVILGWDRKQVEALSYYVTAEAVAEGMLARLDAARRKG